MLTNFPEQESDSFTTVHLDLLLCWLRFPLRDAFLESVSIPLWPLSTGRSHYILLPRGDASIISEKVPSIFWEMLPSKQLITHRKLRCVELPFVSAIVKMPRAPTGVDQLPIAIVDPHGVPGVSGSVARWWRLAIFDSLESKTLAMPSYHDALQPCTLGDGFVGSGVSFTDSEARENSVTSRTSPRTAGKEASNVVVDVMMAPSKNCASLIRWRGERAAEIVR